MNNIQTLKYPASDSIDMVTPNQIITERSALVDKIIVHFGNWKTLKTQQTKDGHNTNWSVGALFNILDFYI